MPRKFHFTFLIQQKRELVNYSPMWSVKCFFKETELIELLYRRFPLHLKSSEGQRNKNYLYFDNWNVWILPVITSSLISQMLHVPTSHVKNGNRTQNARSTEMIVSGKDRTWTWTLVQQLNELTSFVQFKVDNNKSNFEKWIYNWNALWKILMLAKKETSCNSITAATELSLFHWAESWFNGLVSCYHYGLMSMF